MPTAGGVTVLGVGMTQSPASSDVAVLVAGGGNHGGDQGDLSDVGAKARPEAIPGTADVVGPSEVQEPVPHHLAQR